MYLEIGVDFYISATDFLEIEIYYIKKHLFLDWNLFLELDL